MNARRFSLAIGAAALLGGCASSRAAIPPVTTVASMKAADAYVAVVRWQLGTLPAPPATDDTKPVVYLAPADGDPLSAGIQAAVVEAVKDEATVRFADTRKQAVDTGSADAPVKDGAVLLVVGRLPASSPPVDLQVEVYRNESDDHTVVVSIGQDVTGVRVVSSAPAGAG